MMRKTLFSSSASLLILLACIVGCEEPVKRIGECALMKITTLHPWGENVIHLTYQSGQLVKIGPDTVIYKDGNIVSIGEFRKFQYDSKGLLLSKYVYDIASFKYFYSYNSTNQVIQVNNVIDRDPEYSPQHEEFEYDYLYENESSLNPTRIVDGDEFEFDGNKRPMHKFNALIFGDIPGLNNLVKIVNANDGITTFVYEYNEWGYPVKATSSKPIYDSTVTLYEYNCR